MIEHDQKIHLLNSQNVAKPRDKNIKLSWQPSWTLYPSYQKPFIVKVTQCEIIQD